MSESPEKSAQQQIALKVDESKLNTHYANAFRTNTSSEELFLDFGTNMLVRNNAQDAKADQPVANMTFDVQSRVIMNYQTTKRLAMLLAQVVRQHEERFGEIKIEGGNQ